MENTINTPETLIFKDAKDNDSPKPSMLFSNFWHQGELAVFFGNQQSGKSLLAVQVADAISTGKTIDGFKLESEAQKVLYFDFDKSGYHFNQRYQGYQFNPNFRRLVLNKKNLDFKHLAEQLFFSIEELICEEGAEILIFDSLPVIKCFVKDSYFLKGIQNLKETYGVSILLIGETKKEIKGKPLRLNHLDAHKQLMGFADSVFAIGHTSGEENERYLIHLKSNEKRTHNKNNVVMGRLMPFDYAQGDIPFGYAQGDIPFGYAQGDSLRTATASTRGVMPSVAEACDRPAVTGVTPVTPLFSGFAFTGYNTESYVISPPEELELEILHLKQQQPELSFGEIAKQLKTNKMKVKRVLERYPVKLEILKPKFDKMPASLSAVPFRGNDELSGQPTERGVTTTSSPNPLLSPAVLAQGGMPNAEPVMSVTTANTAASSFSNPGLQSGGAENIATLPTDSLRQGNDNPLASLPSTPFRDDVEESSQPSKPGVKAPEPLNNKLTFSQRVKKQIAKKNMEKMKSR